MLRERDQSTVLTDSVVDILQLKHGELDNVLVREAGTPRRVTKRAREVLFGFI